MTDSDRIVDTAIAQAERKGSWEAVRLHDVATELGMSLEAVRQQFREKEEIVDAWFDRADAAMLTLADAPGFGLLTPRERVQRLILAWLEALAPHRRVTRQMIYGKLEPGHLHVQVPGVLRVSRTVQWIREAAHRDATYLRRALEETGLTTLYLMTFVCWLHDESPDSSRTHRLLERSLKAAERVDHWFCAGRRRARDASSAGTQRAAEEPTL